MSFILEGPPVALAGHTRLSLFYDLRGRLSSCISAVPVIPRPHKWLGIGRAVVWDSLEWHKDPSHRLRVAQPHFPSSMWCNVLEIKCSIYCAIVNALYTSKMHFANENKVREASDRITSSSCDTPYCHLPSFAVDL